MRKVVISNFKGGVGKTTTAVNLAVGLARKNRKVLLIDTDSQTSATVALGVDPDATSGVYGLIVDDEPFAQVVVAVEKNLDMLPASRALAPVDQWLAMKTARETILRRRLEAVTGYDYILIDTPPAFSVLNLNSFNFATEAWLPVSMEYLALQGVQQVVETLQMIADELSHELPIRYVIPTFHDRRNLKTKAVVDALKASFNGALTPAVRMNVKLSEAPSHHKSIFDYAPTSPGAEDFWGLVKRIVKDERQEKGSVAAR